MSPKSVTDQEARRLATDMFVAYGAKESSAATVADHLVDSERSGVRTHGMIRVPQYVDEILSGELEPGTLPSVRRSGGSWIEVDGERSFGQTACTAALGEAAIVARENGIALATVRNMGHAGRLGAYAEVLGRQGFLSMLFCSGARSGHRVAPFNGREARLSTNPIAFSVPTHGPPIVGDFSTASAPEGRIRLLRNLGQQAPPDTLLDSAGRPTTDPNVLYEKVPGTILPLGGERLGYRGYGMAVLVDAMATVLAGDEVEDASRLQNNVGLVVASTDESFASRAQRMAEYLSSSAPRGNEPVLLPGELEERRRASSEKIDIDDRTWDEIVERAARRSVSLAGI